ncbi:MAG: hypothetical protein AMJ55_08055 [Gammaproteobacteria bacterium SG8_15]|nr:MAG: hypothetical protein AMJ55_08055 [Gammaproteobacteria bacterium SG8_15]
MFNRKLLSALVATGLVVTGSYTANVLAATDDGVADAVILIPLSIAHDTGASLDFGTITPDGDGATVRVTTAGVASVTGGDAILSGTTSADSFTVSGQGGQNYNITLPGSITLTGPGDDMTVNNVVSNPATSSTLPAGLGTQTETLTIGGDLVIGADQGAGSYSGTYTVEVVWP